MIWLKNYPKCIQTPFWQNYFKACSVKIVASKYAFLLFYTSKHPNPSSENSHYLVTLLATINSGLLAD
jgi:hypothetical protein